MAIEYNFTLDMDRSKRDNNIAYARTGDVDSITINADLVLNGAAYTPTGANAFFECVTPNGHSIRAAAEKTGSTVSVEVPSAAFQAAGVINVAYFRFESGEADNPTYVESTEPFAIVVREGIGDNIDAGDYIEEWRQLADHLEAVVSEVEQKAEQAETAIDEQKTEVDQLKAQAQVAIAGDVTEVEETAQSAIAAINQEKADVANAAEGITEAGEQAINTFKTNSQQAINQFNTNGTSAINQFNTDADAKLEEVDGMITEAQGDVDAAITQLEDKTQEAIDAAQDALDGTTATNLQNAINRTLKLDVADMTVIQDNSSLSSFTNVGSYCCKTAATAATIGDCPVDDSPFNMYVFSSATSGQVMQLVVPIDLNGKPTAEWHVRFGTSSAMDKWSVIGGGADIAAGLGIDVTGDAKKTVSLDTDAFYQHHEAAEIIQGSTEVTGGGRFKELTVYGNTRQNLWVNPNSRTANGITTTPNDDGTVSFSGTATQNMASYSDVSYVLKPGATYTASVDKKIADNYGSADNTGACFVLTFYDSNNAYLADSIFGYGSLLVTSITVPSNVKFAKFGVIVKKGQAISGTYRVMLNEGSIAEPWCPPGLNGVDELAIVTAGKNLLTETLEGVAPSVKNTELVNFGKDVIVDDMTLSVIAETDVIYDRAGAGFVNFLSSDGTNHYVTADVIFGVSGATKAGETKVISIPDVPFKRIICYFRNDSSSSFDNDCRLKLQLELGPTATAYEPPDVTTTPVDLQGHTLRSLPDGTRDELRIDGTGAVTLVQRVAEFIAPASASSYTVDSAQASLRYIFKLDEYCIDQSTTHQNCMCDKVPPRESVSATYAETYVIAVSNNGYVTIGSGETARFIADNFGGATLLYPLATPKTVELLPVVLPELASPGYTVFASSNVPAEIEADVVKVDYLLPSDVYTKEEVDKKIDDAGMPDVVPVSQGGTGVTTAAAERNRLGLGNTTGALPVANGGTGGTSAKAAQNSLLNDMNVSSDALTDSSMLVGYNASPSASNGAVHKRSVSTVWDYIAGKIRSTFGFSSSNVLPVSNGGTGVTANPSILVNVGSESASDVLSSSPRPGVTGTLPVSHGGTGATAPGVDMLSNLGITFGTADPPSTGTPGSIYIQYFE